MSKQNEENDTSEANKETKSDTRGLALDAPISSAEIGFQNINNQGLALTDPIPSNSSVKDVKEEVVQEIKTNKDSKKDS